VSVLEQTSVLIVDDEIGPRESLRAILKPDYQVFVAAEGEQALRVVEQNPVDVVLLDLRMPGLSGIQVLEKIKALDPDIEVILVTGYASYDTVLEALRLRAFDYVPKPFHVPQVREMVKRATTQRYSHLRLKQAAAELEQRLGGIDTIPTTATTEFISVLNDLHTSLQTVDGCGQILQQCYSDHLDPPGKNALHQLCTAGQRMGTVINDLFSRIRRQSVQQN
jgi:YesN/AraC family two-component response regulator